MNFNIEKEQVYDSKNNRKVYISIYNFNFILTQEKFLKYILSFLLAYKNFNLSCETSAVLTNHASTLYNLYLEYDSENKIVVLKHKNFSFNMSKEHFILICKRLENELDEIVDFCGYDKNDFDIIFLHSCADNLLNIKNISIKEVELNKLYGNIHSDFGNQDNIQVLTPLKFIPAYNYLSGGNEEFLKYKQYNYLNIDNETRLKRTLESVQQSGYPLNNNYIILFKDSYSIKDGLHRASVLAHLYGLEYKVPVMQIEFERTKQMYDSAKNFEFSKSFNMFEEQILKINSQYKKIAIYGYGKVGKYIETKLDNIVTIADINYKKINLPKVCHPKELSKYDLDCIVISVLGREKQIQYSLDSFLKSDINIEIFNI